MKLATIENWPGKNYEILGLVKGTVVQSKNLGKDFMAGMKTLVGGEIVGYTEMIVEARAIATKRMVDEAEALDAALRLFLCHAERCGGRGLWDGDPFYRLSSGGKGCRGITENIRRHAVMRHVSLFICFIILAKK